MAKVHEHHMAYSASGICKVYIAHPGKTQRMHDKLLVRNKLGWEQIEDALFVFAAFNM